MTFWNIGTNPVGTGEARPLGFTGRCSLEEITVDACDESEAAHRRRDRAGMQPITDSARNMVNTVCADLLNTKKK
jgi:hypothetical protein